MCFARAKAHCLGHIPRPGPGYIRSLLGLTGHSLTVSCLAWHRGPDEKHRLLSGAHDDARRGGWKLRGVTSRRVFWRKGFWYVESLKRCLWMSSETRVLRIFEGLLGSRRPKINSVRTASCFPERMLILAIRMGAWQVPSTQFVKPPWQSQAERLTCPRVEEDMAAVCGSYESKATGQFHLTYAKHC